MNLFQKTIIVIPAIQIPTDKDGDGFYYLYGKGNSGPRYGLGDGLGEGAPEYDFGKWWPGDVPPTNFNWARICDHYEKNDLGDWKHLI